MKEIEEIVKRYPEIDYDPWLDELYDYDDSVSYNGGKALIEAYFEGMDIVVSHPSDDPQKELSYTVSGEDYIEIEFMGNYNKALERIKDNLK